MRRDPFPPSERSDDPEDSGRVRNRLWALIDRYAEDCLREGKSLLRTVRRTVVIVGTLIALALVGLIVVIGYALLR